MAQRLGDLVMLKKRICATLLYDGVGLVKGERFQTWRRVGSLIQAVKLFTLRQADELIILDVAATKEGRGPDIEMVKRVAEHCFVPLTVGGGVRSVEDVGRLLEAGADRVSIKTCWRVIPECCEKFGSQAIVASLDRVADELVEGFVAIKSAIHGADMSAGAGEVMLGDVELDGTLKGLRRDRWPGGVHIRSGGISGPDDCAWAFDQGYAAVAIGALFQFTHWTPKTLKEELSKRGYPMRLASYMAGTT